ncbi:unnamed protein product, partial [Rotaria sordida]
MASENGWYTVACGARRYSLPVRYHQLTLIENGGFSDIMRAQDTATGDYVAIKKLLRPFDNELYAKITYRKLKLLTYLNHPIANFIHSAGITHCDITPDNIEIDDETNVTICNFDLAHNASIDFNHRCWTRRGYYAPEVVTKGDTSNPKRDIWSVGCIMGELIRRKITFQGTDILTVLQEIFNLVDIPDIKTLNEICYKSIDLLKCLLSFDYRQRPTAVEAIAHPFLNEYRYPDEEPTVARMIDEHFDADYGVSKWK